MLASLQRPNSQTWRRGERRWPMKIEEPDDDYDDDEYDIDFGGDDDDDGDDGEKHSREVRG